MLAAMPTVVDVCRRTMAATAAKQKKISGQGVMANMPSKAEPTTTHQINATVVVRPDAAFVASRADVTSFPNYVPPRGFEPPTFGTGNQRSIP